jgi:hypothetical protein
MRELIERLEKATGSDDALNVDLYAEFGEGYPIARTIAERRVVPDYTGSIDAAVALAERLVGARFGGWWAILHDGVIEFGKTSKPSSDLPRFILLALLRALSAKGSPDV